MSAARMATEAVAFESEGATLRGRLYRATRAQQAGPLLIMAHGTSATIRMVADEYAAAFARGGFNVLLYDHRNLGSSDGEPRQEINPWIQSRGYIDAITFAQSLAGVDPTRIALWGDSYTGGQVVMIAACDDRVRAVVAQCPVFGATLPTIDATPETFAIIKHTLLHGDVHGTPATTTGPLPVVSADQAGTPSLLQPIQAFRWFIDYGGRPGSGWSNSVTRVIPPTPILFNPVLCAPFVKVPVLLMVAPADEMVHANYAVAKAAYAMLPEPKHWHDIADGHFGLLYHPSERFDEASGIQIAFLQRHLLHEAATGPCASIPASDVTTDSQLP
jgi:pimeloyl-ACP methyl ester carboxylesterase